jgi:hypothetical protein
MKIISKKEKKALTAFGLFLCVWLLKIKRYHAAANPSTQSLQAIRHGNSRDRWGSTCGR